MLAPAAPCSTSPPSPTAPSGWSRRRAPPAPIAADAVAVRSMSLSIEVRDGAVEESERAEGDDLGLRVLVGRRQAVVSTNDTVGRRQRGAGRARGGDGAGGAGGQICRARRREHCWRTIFPISI